MSQPPPPPMRVLVADDDEDIRALMCDAITSDRVECFGVDTGLKAILALIEDWYDVLLLDLRMPGLSGRDVMTLLRFIVDKRAMGELRVIVVTGATDLSAEELRRMGAHDVLFKPFDTQLLRDTVFAN